jgi:hypothetical protein
MARRMLKLRLTPKEIESLLKKDHGVLYYTFDMLGRQALNTFLKQGNYNKILNALIEYRNYRMLRESNPNIELIYSKHGFQLIDRERKRQSSRCYEQRKRR